MKERCPVPGYAGKELRSSGKPRRGVLRSSLLLRGRGLNSNELLQISKKSLKIFSKKLLTDVDLFCILTFVGWRYSKQTDAEQNNGVWLRW